MPISDVSATVIVLTGVSDTVLIDGVSASINVGIGLLLVTACVVLAVRGAVASSTFSEILLVT